MKRIEIPKRSRGGATRHFEIGTSACDAVFSTWAEGIGLLHQKMRTDPPDKATPAHGALFSTNPIAKIVFLTPLRGEIGRPA